MRFKTEQEFIQEFGKDWRDDVQYTWKSPEMDRLLGTAVPEATARRLRVVDEAYMTDNGIKWTISSDMVVDGQVTLKESLAELYKLFPVEDIISQALIDLREKEG